MINIRTTEPLAFLTAFLMCLITVMPFSASYYSYALGIFILFFIYELHSYLKKGIPFRLRLTRPEKILFLGIIVFYGLVFLSVLSNGNNKDFHKFTWELCLAVPAFLMWWIGSRYDIKNSSLLGMTIGMLIICLIGLKQYFGDPGIRIESLYAHPNHFGTMINLTAPFIIYMIGTIKKKSIQAIGAVTVGLEAVCLYLTSSRGAILGLAVGIALAGLFTAGLYHREISKKNMLRAGLVILLVILFGIFAFGKMEANRTEQHFGGERLPMIEASIEMWKDHKITGVGLAQWEVNYYGNYRPSGIQEEDVSMPHNMPLYFLSTTGILGFTGYAVFILAAIYSIASLSKTSPDRYWIMAVFTMFFTFFIQGFVDTTIINKIPARAFYAFLMLGLVAESHSRCKQKG